jgi:di/tricarboxylate transporter
MRFQASLMTSKADSEIAELERDLSNLHRRYVVLERSARRMKLTFYAFLVALVLLIVVSAVVSNTAAAVASLVVLLSTFALAYGLRSQRWIDIASGPWGLADHVRYIEAQAVEDMVTERMARLDQLKGKPK